MRSLNNADLNFEVFNHTENSSLVKEFKAPKAVISRGYDIKPFEINVADSKLDNYKANVVLHFKGHYIDEKTRTK